MNTRQLAATVLLGIAMLATACSSSAEQTEAPAQSTTEAMASQAAVADDPQTAPTTGLGDGPIDKDELLDLVERTLQRPYRAESFWSLGEDDEFDTSMPVTSSEFDGTWSSVRSTLGPNQANGVVSVHAITDRKTGYLFTPGWADAPRSVTPGVLERAIDAWIVVDLERLKAEFDPATPIAWSPSVFETADDLIAAITNARHMAEGPPSTSRGVATRTFILMPPETDTFSMQGEIEVKIDSDGNLRELATRAPFEARSEFYDFGADITIEFPSDAIESTDDYLAYITPSAGTPVDESLQATPAPRPTIAPEPSTVTTGPTLSELVAVQPELSIFFSMLQQANATPLLVGSDFFIVIAPTNDAIESLGVDIDALLSDPVAVEQFVTNHLLPGDSTTTTLEALAARGGATALSGQFVEVTTDGSRYRIGQATVIFGDVAATNGVMHIVDRPLQPAE